MCLDIRDSVQKPFLRKLKKQKRIRCFKICSRINRYHYLEDRLAALYRGGYFYKPGINNSSRDFTTIDSYEMAYGVQKGIHVYLTREIAEGEVQGSRSRRILPVWCKVKDFVAAGTFCNTPCAVFTKVSVHQRDYDRAIK